MHRSWRMLLWVLLSSLLVVRTAPARGAELTETPPAPPRRLSPPSEPTPAVSHTHDVQPAEDDYAHVFYQFTAASGVRVFILTAQGIEREITSEPGWEALHKAALERLRRARREGYIQSHSELDQTIRDAVATGRLMRGMTAEQVRACVGDAVEENRTLAPEGLVEDWRYRIILPKGAGELSLLEGEDPCGEGTPAPGGRECTLHFLDGVLVTWGHTASEGGTNSRAPQTPIRSSPPSR